MKRVVVLMLTLVLCLSLFACSKGKKADPMDTKMVITNSSGQTEYMSANDLIAINKENEAKYENNYDYQDVTITGTVVSVKSDWNLNPQFKEAGYVIMLEEGWKVEVMAIGHEEVETLSKGDKIKVYSKTQYCVDAYVGVNHFEGQIGGRNKDLSTITILERAK